MSLASFEESVSTALAESARGDDQAATERLSVALLQCPASHPKGRARALAQLAHDHYPGLGNLQASVQKALILKADALDLAAYKDVLTGLHSRRHGDLGHGVGDRVCSG